MKAFLKICLLLVLCCPGYAQKGLGTWNIFNVKYGVGAKWSVFGEAQLRSLKFYNHFHYHEYKVGVSYKIHPQLQMFLGVGNYDTYKEGGNFVRPKNNDEVRVWPQLSLTQTLWKIKVEQRYRMELRFTSQGYKNRFRYRTAFLYAFGKEQNGHKPFLLSASNEVFFTDRAPYFERNRLQLSLQRKISSLLSVQAGYIYQFDYKINDETGRNFMVLGLYVDIKGKHK